MDFLNFTQGAQTTMMRTTTSKKCEKSTTCQTVIFSLFTWSPNRICFKEKNYLAGEFVKLSLCFGYFFDFHGGKSLGLHKKAQPFETFGTEKLSEFNLAKYDWNRILDSEFWKNGLKVCCYLNSALCFSPRIPLEPTRTKRAILVRSSIYHYRIRKKLRG